MRKIYTRKTFARNLRDPVIRQVDRCTYVIGYNLLFLQFSIAGLQKNRDILCGVPAHFHVHIVQLSRKCPEKLHLLNLH